MSSLHQDTNSHYEVSFQSQPQRSTEEFNCPYQLGYVADTPNRCENPNDASWFEYPVYCEDIIVSGNWKQQQQQQQQQMISFFILPRVI